MTEVVSESNDVLDQVHVVAGDIMMLVHTENVKSRLCAHRLDGTCLKTLDIPVGRVSDASGKRKDGHFLFSLISFNMPRIVYDVDVENGAFDMSVIRRSNVSA